MNDSSKPSNPPLQSTGTLRAESRSDGLRNILFVPDADHTVHHRRETLAVFVPAHTPGEAHAIPVNEAPIKLSIPANPDAVFVQTVIEAAVRQCGVDVEVDLSDSDLPTLVALTVPAATHRK